MSSLVQRGQPASELRPRLHVCIFVGKRILFLSVLAFHPHVSDEWEEGDVSTENRLSKTPLKAETFSTGDF